MSARSEIRGDLDAWLTLSADLVITAALLQSSLSGPLGLSLPWLAVLLPAVLANTASAIYARRHGLTALAFGPNTVFIVVFGRAVLGPRSLEWTALGLTTLERTEAAIALLGASLLVYALIVALSVLLLTRWRPVLPRRALVLPLAAICWTHLVGTSVRSLASENLAVWVPAVLLFALLLFTHKGPITWVSAIGLWALLSAVMGPSSSSSIGIAASSIPIEAALFDPTTLGVLSSAPFWREVFPLLAALGLANGFGVLENVAAAWEVGDRHSPRVAVGVVTAGTALSALLGAGAPVTVYIGHPAFRARGARWLYAALAAITLFGLAFAFERGVLDWFPIAIFHGAVLYLGVMVGLLPRKYLVGAKDLSRALFVMSPIIAGWLSITLGTSAPSFIDVFGRGGGLIAVAWGFLVFEELSRRERATIYGLLSVGSVVGLVHAAPGTRLGLGIATLYVLVALADSRRRSTQAGSGPRG